MTALRITSGSTQLAAVNRVQASASRLAQLQEQLASGQKISKPSDDPAGVTKALGLQSQLSRNTQYSANAKDAISFLATADTAYKSLVEQAQKVRDLVLQGMNTGASSPAAASALANQVDSLRDNMAKVANSSYNGQLVFGGTSSSTNAFNNTVALPGVYLYKGDTGTVSRDVGPGNSVTINQIGTSVFGADGSNIFDTMTAISAALRTNPSALGPQLTALDTGLNTLVAGQALEGATYNRVTVAQSIADTADTQLTSNLSDVKDIDFAKAVIDVTSANTAYQAALQTTASMSHRSLLDFIS